MERLYITDDGYVELESGGKDATRLADAIMAFINMHHHGLKWSDKQRDLFNRFVKEAEK